MDAILQTTPNIVYPNTLVKIWHVRICKSSECENQYKTVIIPTRCGGNQFSPFCLFPVFRIMMILGIYVTSCTNLIGVTTAGCGDTWQIWTWFNYLTYNFANGALVTRVRSYGVCLNYRDPKYRWKCIFDASSWKHRLCVLAALYASVNTAFIFTYVQLKYLRLSNQINRTMLLWCPG